MIRTALLALLLAGCSTITSNLLPSLDNCSDVKYERHDKAIAIEAKCTAP